MRTDRARHVGSPVRITISKRTESRVRQTVRRVLEDITEGIPWAEAAGRVFEEQGSMGNGGAMRVAPLGAFFGRDDDAIVIEQARLSASTTHAHLEGQAGAIAVALTVAWVMRNPVRDRSADGSAMLEFVTDRTPRGTTRSGTELALTIPFDRPISEAVAALGNGNRITAPDTVPFTLWCAARHLDDYSEALWNVIEAGGDNDTNAAIVGGIVAVALGDGSIPESWLMSREPLK